MQRADDIEFRLETMGRSYVKLTAVSEHRKCDKTHQVGVDEVSMSYLARVGSDFYWLFLTAHREQGDPVPL